LKVIATDAEFEYLNDVDDDDQWPPEQGNLDSDDDVADWRESRQRSRAERTPRQVPSPGWPRDARRYAQREPEPAYDDAEPVAERQPTRRVVESGVRSRADRGQASSRTVRRTAGEDPPAVPRASRRPAVEDFPDEREPTRPRAARRPAERDREDVDDLPVPRSARYAIDLDDTYDAAPTVPRPTRRTSERSRTASAGHGRLTDQRTQALIAQGRSSARGRLIRARNITIGVTIGVVLATVLTMVVFRKGASWPPSVSVVQTEITTACQNPNVASEPNQVNFACGKGTSQVLWVFALMTSGDNPSFADAKSGRKGLEPITEADGGEVAWSLDLHHPYDPLNSIDSLEVAARAINNIVGGASLTSSSGKPVVQPGLLSNPTNCAKYTGSAAVIARAGFPDICASPVTSAAGQAALVADIYSQWLVGAPAVDAQEASILFQNANDPGNPQVQAILRTLPGANAST
jgi:hypothetical protein